MGYFSNGTQAMDYESRYCAKCVNYRDNGSGSLGCPIMDAHAFANYDQLRDGEGNLKTVLSILIPRDKSGIGNEECSMFLPGRNDTWNDP